MRTSAALSSCLVAAWVVGAACVSCTPAEDPVVVRHPVRQLIVETVKTEPAEVATEPIGARGKYGTGKEQMVFAHASVAITRPPIVPHRPAPPPR